MMDDRLMTAIGRLDRALSRIEKSCTTTAAWAGDDDLALRHVRLRDVSQSVLQRLDRIIAEQEAAE
jgi:hypothetical protein